MTLNLREITVILLSPKFKHCPFSDSFFFTKKSMTIYDTKSRATFFGGEDTWLQDPEVSPVHPSQLGNFQRDRTVKSY